MLARPGPVVVESLEERRLLSVAVGGAGAGIAVASATSPPFETVPAIVRPALGSPVGVTIHTEASDRFSGTVGILNDFVPPPGGVVGVGLQEVINWGDGSATSRGTLGTSGSGGRQWLVKGSHTYKKPGTYNITVSVVWGPLPGSKLEIPSTLLATIKSKAVVAKDDDGGVTRSETAGKSFTATVGNFDFRAVDLVTTATIDWGDGTHSGGKIVGSLASGEWHVVGTHTYTKAGVYKIHVTVKSHIVAAPATVPSGTVASWISTINVHAAA